LRKWKKGKGSKEEYNRGKREYKELCERTAYKVYALCDSASE